MLVFVCVVEPLAVHPRDRGQPVAGRWSLHSTAGRGREEEEEHKDKKKEG